MSQPKPQPAPDVRPTEHRDPAPSPAEHNDRFRETHPNDVVGDR